MAVVVGGSTICLTWTMDQQNCNTIMPQFILHFLAWLKYISHVSSLIYFKENVHFFILILLFFIKKIYIWYTAAKINTDKCHHERPTFLVSFDFCLIFLTFCKTNVLALIFPDMNCFFWGGISGVISRDYFHVTGLTFLMFDFCLFRSLIVLDLFGSFSSIRLCFFRLANKRKKTDILGIMQFKKAFISLIKGKTLAHFAHLFEQNRKLAQLLIIIAVAGRNRSKSDMDLIN